MVRVRNDDKMLKDIKNSCIYYEKAAVSCELEAVLMKCYNPDDPVSRSVFRNVTAAFKVCRL